MSLYVSGQQLAYLQILLISVLPKHKIYKWSSYIDCRLSIELRTSCVRLYTTSTSD